MRLQNHEPGSARDVDIIDVFSALDMLEDGADSTIPSSSDTYHYGIESPRPELRLKICTRSCTLIRNEVADWIDRLDSSSRWAICRTFSSDIRHGLDLPCTSTPLEGVEDGSMLSLFNKISISQSINHDTERFLVVLDLLSRLAALILLGSTVTLGEAGSVNELSTAPREANTCPQMISALGMHAIARSIQPKHANQRTPGPSIAAVWPGLMKRDREEVWADELTQQRRLNLATLSDENSPRRLDSFFGASTPRGSVVSRQVTISRRSTNLDDYHGSPLYQPLSLDHEIMQDSLERQRRRAYEVLGIEQSRTLPRTDAKAFDPFASYTRTSVLPIQRRFSNVTSRSSPAALCSRTLGRFVDHDAPYIVSSINKPSMSSNVSSDKRTHFQYSLSSNQSIALSSTGYQNPVERQMYSRRPVLPTIESSDIAQEPEQVLQQPAILKEPVGESEAQNKVAVPGRDTLVKFKSKIHFARSVRKLYLRRRQSLGQSSVQVLTAG